MKSKFLSKIISAFVALIFLASALPIYAAPRVDVTKTPPERKDRSRGESEEELKKWEEERKKRNEEKEKEDQKNWEEDQKFWKKKLEENKRKRS
jgi:hypothetical protein